MLAALSVPKEVTFEKVIGISEYINQTAEDIHRRRPMCSLDDQIHKCIIGMVGELGAHDMLSTSEVWSRFSKQETYEDRMYDLEVIQREMFHNWLRLIKLDVKTSNRYCNGLFFAFNCFDINNREEYEEQKGRPGANLHFFIRKSLDTELLLLVHQQVSDTGWTVTSKYLIHRNAFNSKFVKSGYKDSPYYFLRYNELIRAGLCYKIPQQLLLGEV